MQILNTVSFQKPGSSYCFYSEILKSHNQCLPMGAANSCNSNLVFYKRSQDNLPAMWKQRGIYAAP